MSDFFRNQIGRLFRWNETRIHELNYLFWECTTRCNLHCRHCGSDCNAAIGDKCGRDAGIDYMCGRNAASPDMPLADFLRAIDTIPKQEIVPRFTVVLTGGEPLLRPDIEDVGRAIRERGMGWSMVSNGWFYDEEKHFRLMSAGMGALTISLDGLKTEHDWMRGREGCYERTLNAIAIAARDKRLNFDVVTCVNQRNLSQLKEIHDLLASLGVRQWRIFTIIPIGRAKQEPLLHLTNSQFVELMDFIADKRERTAQAFRCGRNAAPPDMMNVTFSCEGYLGRYEWRVRQNPYFCHAGINIASVLIDGTICACPNIDREAFGQGNIYRDNLWEVWNQRFEAFRDRSWARRGKCKSCNMFRDCLGNGMHNWHGDCSEVINCHYGKVIDN